MTHHAASKTFKTLLASAALAATGTIAAAQSPVASAVGADSTTCFNSGAPAGAGVVVNGTAAAPGGSGFLNFYQPSETAKPKETSSVNFAPGAAVANSVITPVADGEICVYNSESVEVIADVAGWIAPDKLLSFTNGKAIRIFDTRNGNRKLFPSDAECFNPAGNARAGQPTFINVTVAGAESNGFVNIYSKGAATPDANSVINFNARRAVANGVTVTTGVDSEICVYTSAVAHVIIDVVGAVQNEEFRPANADNTAVRVLNTRDSSPFAAAEKRCVATEALPGESVVLNATAFQAGGKGFLNVFSSDATADPAANSIVNFRPQSNIANGTIVPAGVDGQVCVYSSAGTGVILDVAGYMAPAVFVPANTDGSATRVLNTRDS